MQGPRKNDAKATAGHFLADRFLDLRLPAKAGCEIVLVQPYAKSGGTCVGATEQPPFEFPGSIGVRAKWRRNRQGRAFDADIAQTR